jgi:galactokinase
VSRAPEGVWFAPGRVNLMGGPDYNETFVLPFALGAGVYVAASRRSDGRLAFTSRQAADERSTVLPIEGLAPGSVGGWAAYPAGVAWALREAGYLAGGADLAIDADLPVGAGLSSSAALECAVALALTGLYGVTVPRRELAGLARRAENEFCGVPSGMMDQLAALLGRAGHALLLDCRTGTVEPVPFDPGPAGLTVLIIDTRVRHALSDGRYAERRRACEAGALAMGVRSLRDVTGELERLSDPALRRVCEHVVAETRRVLRAAELLRSGGSGGSGGEAWAAVGELLTVSHDSLRDRFGVSWPEADEAVAAAIEAGGAGARMTGGGFGGCVVALVPADGVEEVRGAVTERFARHRWAAPAYLHGVPADGGRRLRGSGPHRHRDTGPASGADLVGQRDDGDREQ